MREYDDHPLAAIFPLMDDAELKDLAADIEANGLKEKVWLYEGKVLDGRNRLRACRLADVDPRFEEYRGRDPLAFVVSANLHRRHLTVGRRAMISARISGKNEGANLPLTQKEAADLFTVSERTVKSAAAVQANGTPELVKAVEAGEVTVSAAAEVARLPKERQRKAVAGGPKKVKAEAKKARKNRERRERTYEELDAAARQQAVVADLKRVMGKARDLHDDLEALLAKPAFDPLKRAMRHRKVDLGDLLRLHAALVEAHAWAKKPVTTMGEQPGAA